MCDCGLTVSVGPAEAGTPSYGKINLNFKDLHNRRRGRTFAYAPLFIWIAVILILGSGPGSSAQTSRFIKPLIDFFFPGAAPDTFLLVHAAIRKTAHFVEYAVLALLAARAFLATTNARVNRYWLPLSLAIVAAVAATDEFNQSFYSTRTSSVWDVLLDAAGGVFALLCVAIFRRTKDG